MRFGWAVKLGLLALVQGFASAVPGPVAAKPPGCAGAAASSIPRGTALQSGVLDRGVNMTDVLRPSVSLSQVRHDLRAARAMGFRHVRVPVSPAWVLAWDMSGPATSPQRLDGVVCAALEAGLAIILDAHPEDELALKDASGAGVRARLGTMWDRLAGRYAAVSPAWLVFEAMNEPGVTDPSRWAGDQAVLLSHIRRAAPGHTVLLTASPGSTADSLAGLAPLPDANVGYVFHFYGPMVFTHQGADWSSAELGTVRGLGWPPTPGNVAAVRRNAAPGMQRLLSDLVAEDGGVAAIRAEIGRAAAWATRERVRLTVTELGVYDSASAGARAAWLQDVTQALQRHGIGWTVWEYRGGFGIEGALGAPCAAPGAMRRALGLCGDGGRPARPH